MRIRVQSAFDPKECYLQILDGRVVDQIKYEKRHAEELRDHYFGLARSPNDGNCRRKEEDAQHFDLSWNCRALRKE